MAATINERASPSKRGKRRGNGIPWTLGLLALLFVFWRYVGGPGGFLPGSGSRPDEGPLPGPVPASFHESTARRVVTAQLGSAPPPPPRRSADSSNAAPGATVKVALARKGDRDDAEVTVNLGERAANEPDAVVEVRPGPAASRPEGGRRRFPIRDGKATVSGVRPGDRLVVRVFADGRADVAGEVPCEDGEHALSLRDHATIRGQAQFGDGTPAGDQDMVATLSRAHEASAAVEFRTRVDGAFEFDVPAGHDVLVELRPKGTAAGADVDARVFHRDMLEPETTWELDFVTFERVVVMAEGVVEDAAGLPVANATVLVLPVDVPARALTARSDAEGRFRVRGPGQTGPLEVFAMTEEAAARVPTAVHHGTTGLRLVLAPAGSMRGRVASPVPSLNPLLEVGLRTELRNLYATTPVLSDGTFEFPHVPAGRYGLVVEAPDRTSEALSGIDVAAGAESSDPRLQAVPVSTDLARAPLRVTDGTGAPVVGATVEIAITPTATLRGRTGQDGTLDVAIPKEGAAALVVTHPAYAPHRGSWDGKRVLTLSAERK